MQVWPSRPFSRDPGAKMTKESSLRDAYSKSKYFELLHRPGSIQRNLRQMFLILLLPPVAAVALTLLRLGDPKKGLTGANWNILLMGICMAIGGEIQICTRFKLMMHATSVTLRQQASIVVCGVLAFSLCYILVGKLFYFPAPFRKCFFCCN